MLKSENKMCMLGGLCESGLIILLNCDFVLMYFGHSAHPQALTPRYLMAVLIKSIK